MWSAGVIIVIKIIQAKDISYYTYRYLRAMYMVQYECKIFAPIRIVNEILFKPVPRIHWCFENTLIKNFLLLRDEIIDRDGKYFMAQLSPI